MILYDYIISGSQIEWKSVSRVYRLSLQQSQHWFPEIMLTFISEKCHMIAISIIMLVYSLVACTIQFRSPTINYLFPVLVRP